MKYKALFLDVDGTLVVSGKRNLPSAKVQKSIQELQNKGIHIVLSTGRPLWAMEHIISMLNLGGYCILDHGAQIYDITRSVFVHKVPLTKKQAQQVYKVYQSYGLPVCLFESEEILQQESQIMSTEQVIYGLWSPFVSHELYPSVRKDLMTIPFCTVQASTSWEKGEGLSVDVTHQKATKKYAAEKVMLLLGIAAGQIVGVGDSHNDYPLLMSCGLKVAMGNAVPELKAIADYIAPSVEDDGVAHVVEKFILGS